MQIDSDGRPHDPEVVSGEASDKYRKTVQEFVERARYIPAHHQGQAVAVRCVDFWFRSPDRWTGRKK